MIVARMVSRWTQRTGRDTRHCHAQGCKKATIPKTRTDFWRDKIEGNRERDTRCMRELAALGWRVFTVWECEIDAERLERLADSIRSAPPA